MQLMLIIASVLIGIVLGGENQTRSSLCGKKYQQHYVALNCTPVFENDPECPSLYKCPEAGKNVTGCLYKGRVYSDEHLDIRDPCKKCKCFKIVGKYVITCSSITCSYSSTPYCYKTFKADKCCPTGQKCYTKGEEIKNFCEYNGRKYRSGQQFVPKEDNCQSCICNEDWSGIYGKSCFTVDCTVRYQHEIERGCIPVYSKNRCCPVDYHCEKPEDELQDTTKPLATQDDIQSGKSCEFKGLHYKIGQVLNIKYGKEDCATCTCHIPPIFTCIHKEESCI